MEAHASGGAVTGVHHVRRTVERQPRAPAPAAVVRAGARANAVRRAERAVLRVLAGVANGHRHHAVRHGVDDRLLSLFLHRHVRVPIRRDQRHEPHYAHRVRVRHPAAGGHRRHPVRRLPERPVRLCRRVRHLHGRQLARPVRRRLVRV